ncbi:MAG: hypothetical protein AB7K24_16695 [Gemmataceae bacterium]
MILDDNLEVIAPPSPRQQEEDAQSAFAEIGQQAAHTRRRSDWFGGLFIPFLIGGPVIVLVLMIFVSLFIIGDARDIDIPNDDFFEATFPGDRKELEPPEGLAGADILAIELQPIFQQVGDAFQHRDGRRAAHHFDDDRLLTEMVKQGLVDANERWMAPGLRNKLTHALELHARMLAWRRSELCHFERLPDDNLVLIARHYTEADTRRMRWWLTRRHGTWKIYDLEDLDFGIRFSADVAAVALPHRKDLEAARLLREAISQINAENDARATQLLKQVGDGELPPPLETVRALVKARVAFNIQDNVQCLEQIALGRKHRPDMPIFDYLGGLAHNDQGEYDKALPLLERYRERVGEDSYLLLELGVGFRGTANWKRAAESYRRALDLEPRYGDAFVGLLESLNDADPRDDLNRRFNALVHQRECFDISAPSLTSRRQFGVLFDLAWAMNQADPLYPSGKYYLALARLARHEHGPAVDLFKAALADEADADRRQELAAEFLPMLAREQDVVEAYRAAPDRRAAFAILAEHFQYDDDSLEQLSTEHLRQHPDDPLLCFVRAEILVNRAEFTQADALFQEGMKQPPDEEVLERYRYSRIVARYHSGHHREAYEQIGPREETLEQLTELLFEAGRFDELAALLDVHAAVEPASLEVLSYRFRIKIKQKEYAAAVALFKAALKVEFRDDGQQSLITNFCYDMCQAGQTKLAYQAVPDARVAFRRFLDLLEYDRDPDTVAKLEEVIKLHQAKHPEDPWLQFVLGRGLERAMDWDKAVAAYRKALAAGDEDLNRRITYPLLNAQYQGGHGLAAYRDAAAEERALTFSRLAYLCIADRKPAELEQLIELHRPNTNNQAELFFFQARARLLAKKPKEALPLFQKAGELASETWQRSHYSEQIVTDLHEAGLTLEGYRLVPDKQRAFVTLARLLHQQGKHDELGPLLNEHHQHAPHDPWLHYYRGHSYLASGALGPAEQQLKLACERGAGEANGYLFEDALFLVRVKRGRALATCAEYGLSRRRFQALVQQCINEKQPDQLGQIIDWRRQVRPNDPGLPSWELDKRMLKKDYAGVLATILGEAKLLARPQHQWKRDRYLVLCLIKLRRFEEAVHQAEAIVTDRSYNGDLLVLAHAAGGNVEGACAVLEQLKAPSYLISRCYADEELGPILRGPAFARFRAKYPEPKDDELD